MSGAPAGNGSAGSGRTTGGDIDIDVVVVGAGLSGLVAASELIRGGASVRLLEARDRVGGRTLNKPLGRGAVAEIGGQWIGPGQNDIAALARELGVETFATYDVGDKLFQSPRGVSRYTGRIPKVNPLALIDYARAERKLDRMARSVSPAAPWEAARAEEWDSQTVWSWAQRHTHTESARALLRAAIESVWAIDPADVSLLHLLVTIRAAGGFSGLVKTQGGAQQDRFVGGSQLVSMRLAEQVGDSLLLESPVRRIEHSIDGVRVLAGGATLSASRVIVAMAPAMAGLIDYDPPLGSDRQQLTQRMPQGTALKCFAVYESPFWREQGLSGQAASITGPVSSTFDNSPPDDPRGVLLGFVEGRNARELGRQDANSRKATVLACLVDLFGPRAGEPADYFESSWASDPWTRGCYMGYLTPGGWTSHGRALRAPLGRIHWAGAETATRWFGSMDGAVSAGKHAAAEAMDGLGGTLQPLRGSTVTPNDALVSRAHLP